MIHFFRHYAEDPSATPFAEELRRLNVDHRFINAKIDFLYKNKLFLIFVIYPRLFFISAANSFRSLVFSTPRPDYVVLNTELEVLVFGIVRKLLNLKTLIVFETFIYTDYGVRFIGRIHRKYIRLAIRCADIAVCHSRQELEVYRSIFSGTRCRFVFVPFGLTITERRQFLAEAAQQPEPDVPVLVAAGRSARDYATLLKAIKGLPCKLRIISDLFTLDLDADQTSQVTILDSCFDDDYFRELAGSTIVVIPLLRDSVSAGQMVFLQAGALRKPVIITRTATTVDYVADGENALMVGLGDVADLRAAICRLLDDKALRDRLAEHAAARFEREHSTEAYVRTLVATLRREAAGH
jgi:glycosyltransferase involved in cell wall biosynthesis